jgi:probable F420-dependent oxidoreductase
MIKFGLDLTIWPWSFRRFDNIIEIVSEAEKLGLDSLWVSDHLMYTEPDTSVLEALTTLTAVAMETKRVKIGTKVLSMPFRHPAILAKMGSTLDIISNGRLILGVGAGWYEREFKALNIPFDKRVSRMKEGIEVLKSLWVNPLTTYHGSFYHLEGAESWPKPLQKPHPPIWIGATGPRMLRIVSELGDGWITTNQSPEQYGHSWKTIQDHAGELGRDAACIEPVCYTYSTIATDADRAKRTAEELILAERRRALSDPNLRIEDIEEFGIIGGPDEWIERIEEYVRAGARHIIVKIVPLNLDSMRLYGKKVIPYFRQRAYSYD